MLSKKLKTYNISNIKFNNISIILGTSITAKAFDSTKAVYELKMLERMNILGVMIYLLTEMLIMQEVKYI